MRAVRPRQGATLTGRYAHTLGRDRRTIGALLGQAPLIGLLIAMLYPRGVLDLPDTSPTRSALLVSTVARSVDQATSVIAARSRWTRAWPKNRKRRA